MVKKGVGSWQIDKALTAVQAIIEILIDGKWHRYQELREKAGLSSATLSKHLKELEKGIVEKRLLLNSGEYPYPVEYRIKEEYQASLSEISSLMECASKLETKSNEKNDNKEVISCIILGGRMLDKTMEKAYARYIEDKNVEAFEQSGGIAMSFYSKALRTITKKKKQLT